MRRLESHLVEGRFTFALRSLVVFEHVPKVDATVAADLEGRCVSE